MFKKLLLLIICILMLGGCTPSGSHAATDQRYMVSAMGFDNAYGKIRISLETIIINSENAGEEQKLQVFTGEGESIEAAMEEIGRFLSKPLLLSHCGIIVLGDTLTASQVGNICDYCFKENEITLSVYVVSAEDSNKLLLCNPVSSVAVGYDVMGMIEQQSSRTGMNFKNRYYEVEAGRERTQNIFTVTRFKVSEEAAFFIDGMKIYKDDKAITVLDNRQSILYSMLTDTYSKGEVEFDNKKYKINSSTAKYEFGTNEKPEITVNISIKSGEISNHTQKVMEKQINGLIEVLNDKCKSDAFGFENIFYHKDEKLWQNVKDRYSEFYQKSNIKVKLNVNEKSKK